MVFWDVERQTKFPAHVHCSGLISCFRSCRGRLSNVKVIILNESLIDWFHCDFSIKVIFLLISSELTWRKWSDITRHPLLARFCRFENFVTDIVIRAEAESSETFEQKLERHRKELRNFDIQRLESRRFKNLLFLKTFPLSFAKGAPLLSIKGYARVSWSSYISRYVDHWNQKRTRHLQPAQLIPGAVGRRQEIPTNSLPQADKRFGWILQCLHWNLKF